MKAIYNENLSTSLSFFLRDSHIISVVGAGGKTSLMVKLGNLFCEKNERVLLTTTTHLAVNVDYGKADLFVEKESENRYKTPGCENIQKRLNEYDRVIIEADGSKMLPLKFHTNRDPVIIDETDTVLSVLGLQSLKKPLSKVLFGFDEYREETCREDKVCTLDTIQAIITSKSGALKGVNERRSFIVLNQGDVLSPEEVEKVNKMMFSLKRNYLLISFNENKLYAGCIF